MNQIFIKWWKSTIVFLMIVVSTMVFSTAAKAQEVYLPEGKVSLTFDDGFASTYQNALPIMSSRGIKGTAFITTNYIGRKGYMTWKQLQTLQNVNSWEIGSHTANHSELPLLSLTQIRNQLTKSKTTLTNNGLKVTSFASPYGAYDNRVLAEAAKLYNLHRGFWEREYLNDYPADKIVVNVKSVESGITLAEVKAWIDQANSEGKWLILVFHEVLPNIDPDYSYVTTISDFTEISDYIKSSGIKVVTPNHTLLKPSANLFSNSSFQKGIAEGWTTDSPVNIVLNSANNGSFPSPTQSIVLKGSTKTSHLFSNLITVTNAKSYGIEVFVNADNLTSGEVGFYIDEYDAGGNWISGKWIGAVYADRVMNFARMYTPTSVNVASIKLQTYILSGSVGKVFVDNYEMYSL